MISSNSIALVVIPGTSWLLDSACCNHMTSDISFLSSPIPIQSLSQIHYVDGNHMSISHLSCSKLTFNLASIDQLCDLGLTIVFSSNGCQVQDSQTEQVINRNGRWDDYLRDHISPTFFCVSIYLCTSHQ